MANPTSFAGIFNANNFAYGINPKVPPLQVISGPNAAGSGTLTLAFGTFCTPDGLSVSPLATTAPVLVGSDSNMETQTPSAVSASTPLVYSTTTITYTNWTYQHGNGDQVRSGTVGLQEALNYAGNVYGGGIVIVDEAWYKCGGTAAMISAATVPTGVTIWDNHTGSSGLYPVQSVSVALTLAQILAAHTTPVSIIPAPGAGNMILVQSATLNLIYGSAAYSGGGAAQLSYGTALTYPATATWAATDFTNLSANQSDTVAGAAAVAASTNFINKAITYSNAGANFTVGTGGSGRLYVVYQVLPNVS